MIGKHSLGKSREEGFSLIEIIIVIVILGILAAVSIPVYSGIVDDSRQAAVDGAAASIVNEIEVSKTNEGVDAYAVTVDIIERMEEEHSQGESPLIISGHTTASLDSGQRVYCITVSYDEEGDNDMDSIWDNEHILAFGGPNCGPLDRSLASDHGWYEEKGIESWMRN